MIALSEQVCLGNGFPIVIMAGPCSVEGEEMFSQCADTVSNLGLPIIRGGAFKPRTRPNSFQGLGLKGLSILSKHAKKTGLLTITEAMSVEQVGEVCDYADIIQVGTRNAQNTELLKELGKTRKPVLLKRGFSNTVSEWLGAAEYIHQGGNDRVVMCERGIRTFAQETRFTFDLAGMLLVKREGYAVVADPSHATGQRDLVAPVAMAAIAAGADGLLVEFHPDPPSALSDSSQQLYPDQLSDLVKEIGVLAGGRGLWMKK